MLAPVGFVLPIAVGAVLMSAWTIFVAPTPSSCAVWTSPSTSRTGRIFIVLVLSGLGLVPFSAPVRG